MSTTSTTSARELASFLLLLNSLHFTALIDCGGTSLVLICSIYVLEAHRYLSMPTTECVVRHSGVLGATRVYPVRLLAFASSLRN